MRCYVQDGCAHKIMCGNMERCLYSPDQLGPSPCVTEDKPVNCVLKDGCCEGGRCEAYKECYYGSRTTTKPVKEIDPRTQPANPKQHYGDKKIPLYLLPFSFAANVCVALYEGMTKYGLVNWRVAKVEAMTYASACKRHVDRWIGGQDHDPVTKVRHLANAGACIAILIDAEVNGTLIDNRPFPIKQSAVDAMIAELEDTLAHLKELHADREPKHYTIMDVAS